jgi:very-short-patch-repair endonuclease
VDFVCFEARLVVEIDGGQHAAEVQLAQDFKRTAWLENERFRILRFWNHEVLNQPDAVRSVIVQALTQA